ncbi:hypothetical protein DPMN_162887 [Dreissena polymorpha]|uniref:C2H2-type domain-containing protein n=1 Tax=Dreissena polymorpha TaxID=45954 RepID=A0A9D4ES57_DREPO|nr:hypothetical protein DPMN_162887 [Dreissena polymorpha]
MSDALKEAINIIDLADCMDAKDEQVYVIDCPYQVTKCTGCFELFETIKSLCNHISKRHKDNFTIFKCKICGKRNCSTKGIAIHHVICRKGKEPCQTKAKPLVTEDTQRTVEITMYTDPEEPENMQTMAVHHDPNTGLSNVTEKDTDSAHAITHACSECARTFSTAMGLCVHISPKHPNFCDEKRKTPRRQMLKGKGKKGQTKDWIKSHLSQVKRVSGQKHKLQNCWNWRKNTKMYETSTRL